MTRLVIYILLSRLQAPLTISKRRDGVNVINLKPEAHKIYHRLTAENNWSVLTIVPDGSKYFHVETIDMSLFSVENIFIVFTFVSITS